MGFHRSRQVCSALNPCKNLTNDLSCACQTFAHLDALRDDWTNSWSMAYRASNASSTSRAACHLLNALAVRELIPKTTTNDLLATFKTSLDVLGPATCADTSIALICNLLVFCRESRPGIFVHIARNAVTWIFRTWDPGNITL